VQGYDSHTRHACACACACACAHERARAYVGRRVCECVRTRRGMLISRLLCCSLVDDFLLGLGLGHELAPDGSHRHEGDEKDEVPGVLFPFGLQLLACKQTVWSVSIGL
jgi:hypothetical protein